MQNLRRSPRKNELLVLEKPRAKKRQKKHHRMLKYQKLPLKAYRIHLLVQTTIQPQKLPAKLQKTQIRALLKKLKAKNLFVKEELLAKRKPQKIPLLAIRKHRRILLLLRVRVHHLQALDKQRSQAMLHLVTRNRIVDQLRTKIRTPPRASSAIILRTIIRKMLLSKKVVISVLVVLISKTGVSQLFLKPLKTILQSSK